ncbi:MAG: hypothetical protein NVSMB6_22590 [Burkholderiaceae bacterium]
MNGDAYTLSFAIYGPTLDGHAATKPRKTVRRLKLKSKASA